MTHFVQGFFNCHSTHLSRESCLETAQNSQYNDLTLIFLKNEIISGRHAYLKEAVAKKSKMSSQIIA